MPEFEIEGCYLIEDAVATALVGDCSNYESAARRGRPARVVEPLAARAADRAGRLAQRVHLGRRPVRLDAPVTGAPPGAPYVREPGDDGAARSARLRDAERAEQRARRAARRRGRPARAARSRQRPHPRSCRAPARSSAPRTGISRSSTRDGDGAAHGGEARPARADVGPALVARGEGVAGRVWETGQTHRRSTTTGAGADAPTASLPATSTRPSACRSARRARSSASSASRTASPGGHSAPRRSRSIERFAQLAVAGARERAALHARCSRAKSCTARSSTARPT